MVTVLLGIVEGNALVKMGLANFELPQVVQRVPKCIVGLQTESGVFKILGQSEELLSQLSCRLQLHS